ALRLAKSSTAYGAQADAISPLRFCAVVRAIRRRLSQTSSVSMQRCLGVRDFRISIRSSRTRLHGKSSWQAAAKTPFLDKFAGSAAKGRFWLEKFFGRRQGMPL